MADGQNFTVGEVLISQLDAQGTTSLRRGWQGEQAVSRAQCGARFPISGQQAGEDVCDPYCSASAQLGYNHQESNTGPEEQTGTHHP